VDLSPVEIVVVAFLLALLVSHLVLVQRVATLKTVVARLQRGAAPVAPGSTGLPPDAEAEVWRLVQGGRKIEAIKLVRGRTGLGLKEAKDLVDRL
jgi:large subunit ribosomal protein L7/L12